MKPTHELAVILDRAVVRSGLTKKGLARRAGLAAETLSRIGRRGTADFATVLRVARAAGLELIGDGEAARPNDHSRLDERSLVLHAVVAGKILACPRLIETRVLPAIRRFKAAHSGTGTIDLLEAWERAAGEGVHALLRLCADPSERGRQLRQASPLAALLLADERRAIYEAFAA
jgi:hypothetical protein